MSTAQPQQDACDSESYELWHMAPCALPPRVLPLLYGCHTVLLYCYCTACSAALLYVEPYVPQQYQFEALLREFVARQHVPCMLTVTDMQGAILMQV